MEDYNNTYINPDNPVYISYAWADDKNPDIEKDVDELCNILDREKIYIKRDKDSNPTKRLIPYRWSIAKAAEEIGKGDTVIVVLSERYFTSLACLREFFLIRQNGNLNKRVFYIVIKNGEIRDRDIFVKSIQSLAIIKYNILQIVESNYCYLTKTESFALENNMYADVLGFLRQDTEDKCTMNIEYWKKDKYSKLIEHLKEHIKETIKYGINIDEEVDNCLKVITHEKYDKDAILLIGDSIFDVETDDGRKNLGTVINEIILKKANSLSLKHGNGQEKTLREWYKKNYDEKYVEELKTSAFIPVMDEIKRIQNNPLNRNMNKRLLELLNTNKFNKIMSIGYSDLIYKTIEDYKKGKENIKIITLGQSGFAEPVVEFNGIYFYDLLDMENRKKSNNGSLIFTEYDIVDFVSKCIFAVNKESILPKKYLLTLGTNFPSWALRFMWFSLTKNVNNLSFNNKGFIANQKIDNKTRRFVNSNGAAFVPDNETNRFIDKLLSKLNKETECKNIEIPKSENTFDDNKYNVYVNYSDIDKSKFKDTIPKLNPASEIQYLWRTEKDVQLNDNNDNYDCYVIFVAEPEWTKKERENWTKLVNYVRGKHNKLIVVSTYTSQENIDDVLPHEIKMFEIIENSITFKKTNGVESLINLMESLKNNKKEKKEKEKKEKEKKNNVELNND